MHFRLSILFTGLLFASSASAVDFDEARHLLVRTGFGASPAEIESLRPLTYESAVDQLLGSARTAAVTRDPDWVAEGWHPPRRQAEMSEESKRKLRRTRRRQAGELKAWWLREMIATDSPLTERMTLFWHGHFTSSFRAVKSPWHLHRQNELLREQALGNFGELLERIARDPAMLRYLDNTSNRKGKPNENFARELMELFTLGEGRGYTETDVKEAARAFTGWSIDRRTGGFRFIPRAHDYGTKTVLGRKGRLDGDDVLAALLDHPATAEHLSEKLWAEFVGGEPEPREIRRLAKILRDNDYEIAPWLRALLLSRSFREQAGEASLIRGPVDLVVGTIRTLGVRTGDGRLLARGVRQLGQDLFDPPNVKGWPGGESWIASTTLLLRHATLERLHDAAFANAPRMTAGLPKGRRALTALLLPRAPIDPLPETDDTAELVRALLLDPTYQLN